MATIGKIIQRVQSAYSEGVQSDDTRLSSRHIYNAMVTTRALLLYQKSSKKQKISSWEYQVLPCVELVKVPIHECPCIPPVGCTIYRTKYKLPSAISDLNEHMIEYVTSLDSEVIYSEVEWTDYKYKKGNRYTSSKPDFFLRDGYLYITHKSGPKLLIISGLFNDPLEVYKFPSACNDCQDCVDCESVFDKEFPLGEKEVQALIAIISEELIDRFSSRTQDTTNNSKDDIIDNG